MFEQKKGTLFHWMIFGVLAAFALFFILNQDIAVGLNVKGEWQTSFLRNYFYPEEKVLQNMETSITNFARNNAIFLASTGGYLINSECGITRGKNNWNNKEQFCFPKVKENLQSLFSKKEWRGISYNVSWEGKELVGVANNTLEFGINTILKEKAISKIGERAAACLLNPGHVPFFDLFGKYSECAVCPQEESCSSHINRFYCDVDPCDYGCVSFFTSAEVYSNCDSCPEEGSCEDYINQYYCSLDPCDLNCGWDINSCVNVSDSTKTWQNDVEQKMVFASFPENFNSRAEIVLKPHFRITLGYSFDEYDQLEKEAIFLISMCNQENQLKPCLETNKPTHWKFGDCAAENYVVEERKVPFCVTSPNNYAVIENNLNTVPLIYNFALDFTPTEAIAVQSSEAQTDDTNILVIFNHDETADAYAIYYTDYLNLRWQTGAAQEVFDLVPEFLGYNIQTFPITDWQESCAFMEYNQAYLCNNQINYKFNKTDLITRSDGYLFAITALKEGTESEVKEMIVVE